MHRQQVCQVFHCKVGEALTESGKVSWELTYVGDMVRICAQSLTTE